jgi:predicted nucleic acid-binding protein
MTPADVTKSRILVDTDVVSYLFGDRPQAGFFRPYLQHRTLAVSFMTVAELYFGAYKANWGDRRITLLENHLRNYVVVPFDYELCQRCARIRADRQKSGRQIGLADAWIAASAVAHDCALATNNGKDFQSIVGLELIAPGFE